MSYMSSSSSNHDYGLPLEYFREDLTNYRPRVSGMRQSFGPLDLSRYPNRFDLSSSSSTTTTSYSHSNIGASDLNPTTTTPYYEQSSVGTSNHSSSSRVYPETYLNSSSYDRSNQTYDPIPTSQRGQSAYSGSPSVTPPAFRSGFEGYKPGGGEGTGTGTGSGSGSGMGTTSNSSNISTKPRVTNQPRTNSINRGGSDRREAPADKICDYCGTGFTRNERLRYHIQRVHLNVEPDHGCEVPGCARAFRQKSDLLRHQRTVHKDKFQR
ncbi:hypothetical protein CROQUDRAFT_653053 [Cronartium quercuum f. sp. fusiforme G11]|uniref:C2H2-type domain-containing protein n=1 Tax=Cronartium quercuum f. sp. fusiforme G11 TaxID=708437 RepID=A0A9P6NMD4_9BASI|nr:hypothetical protein CROQUDRAFT_653053 [Cronartium quercuum f. sp. fusiforme G11]